MAKGVAFIVVKNQDNGKVKDVMRECHPDFALIGSNDVHSIDHILNSSKYNFFTEFPDWVRTEMDVARAIRERRTMPRMLDKNSATDLQIIH
jgi:hypothetical protein